MARDLNRRVLFDTVAERYDAYRPSYPEALVDDVLAISGVGEGDRALEIGAGSGQATRLFAARRLAVLAVELGANMVELWRQNLAAYSNAQIVNADFTSWVLPSGSFDLVFSGSAFHWIPPEIGFPKCALALKEGGFLALFWNGDPHPVGGIYDAIQAVYEKVTPEMTRRTQSNHPHGTHEERRTAFENSGLFDAPECREYAWSRELSSEEYVNLCCTYSDHIALPDEQREALCAGIREAIDAHGGTIVREYVTRLYVGKKK